MFSFLRKKPVVQIQKSENGHEVRCRLNYPLGSEWISRSNEPGPLRRGKVVRYWNVGDDFFPVLQDHWGAEILGITKLSAYYPERWAALAKLYWWEQWNVMTHWHYVITESFAKEREKANGK